MTHPPKQQTAFVFSESWAESAKKDGTSLLAAFALILPGVYLDSIAMQWLGFILFAFLIIYRASGARKKAERTPEQMIVEAEMMIARRAMFPTNPGEGE